jgi:glycosyltransferase involved in cell wall biosynthesis
MPPSTLAIDASRVTAANATGTEHYSRAIIAALLNLPDQPFITFYSRDRVRLGRQTKAEVRRVGPPRLWTHLGLGRAMLTDRPDALFVPAHVLPLTRPKASVVTVHDLGFLFEPEAHTRQRRLALELTTRWNIAAARRIISVSESTRTDLVIRFGADPAKIDVVPHGVDHRRFRPLPPEARQSVLDRHGIQGPYILFVGTLQPRKNISRLIDAFERLGQPDLSLVLAGGRGWLSGPIEQRLSASPARDRIRWLGYVPDNDLPALYGGAAAFVFPSLFEGFGMPVIEAMACGCPVVTSNRSSLPEVSGDAAILVDPQSVESILEGIQRALGHEERERRSKAGIDRVSGFTWREAAERTLAVIQRAWEEAHG